MTCLFANLGGAADATAGLVFLTVPGCGARASLIPARVVCTEIAFLGPLHAFRTKDWLIMVPVFILDSGDWVGFNW